MVEKTFVYLKPNALQRLLVGHFIEKFEQHGLKIIAMKLINMSYTMAKDLYVEHKDKDFFDQLMEFTTSGPVVTMVLEGERAVSLVRHIIGATDPLKASPGTLRGEFASSVRKNLVHASENSASARREIGIFFSPDELVDYRLRLEEDF